MRVFNPIWHHLITNGIFSHSWGQSRWGLSLKKPSSGMHWVNKDAIQKISMNTKSVLGFLAVLAKLSSYRPMSNLKIYLIAFQKCSELQTGFQVPCLSLLYSIAQSVLSISYNHTTKRILIMVQ